ncbi:hypothetical protein DPMN_014383 [Dreissena polymorpha]|uniref:Uncharacterized protein n=1 Tax=Dreissena polymorpha TaxID=45954 RepID=A0A9D4NBM0_DREPO|nr:hypothetical protein DPMN_014383 [Dreissena polymorpha]
MAEELGLVQRINNIDEQSKEELARDFPDLIKQLVHYLNTTQLKWMKVLKV